MCKLISSPEEVIHKSSNCNGIASLVWVPVLSCILMQDCNCNVHPIDNTTCWDNPLCPFIKTSVVLVLWGVSADWGDTCCIWIQMHIWVLVSQPHTVQLSALSANLQTAVVVSLEVDVWLDAPSQQKCLPQIKNKTKGIRSSKVDTISQKAIPTSSEGFKSRSL